jgi:hypothetical protein
MRLLRAAVYARDGASAVAALRDAAIAEVPQLAGDGLLTAIGQNVPGADRLARVCIARLRERASDGDDDLADELEAALGIAPQPLLRPIPVEHDRARRLVVIGPGWLIAARAELSALFEHDVFMGIWPASSDAVEQISSAPLAALVPRAPTRNCRAARRPPAPPRRGFDGDRRKPASGCRRPPMRERPTGPLRS